MRFNKNTDILKDETYDEKYNCFGNCIWIILKLLVLIPFLFSIGIMLVKLGCNKEVVLIVLTGFGIIPLIAL